MRLSTLGELRCPYSGSGLVVSDSVVVRDDRLEYGVVRSDCFEFPVVDGVLLLSLAKDYGGPEDTLTPHAALQVAALTFLKKRDVEGLRAWIRRHAPLVSRLIEGRYSNYRDFASDLDSTLAPRIDRELTAISDLEVLGDLGTRDTLARAIRLPARSAVVRYGHRLVTEGRVLRRRLRERADPARRAEALLHSYYLQRFFSVRASATAVALSHLPTDGKVLSVCCGHGVFENILHALRRSPESLVCMDGQLINLLAVRELIGVDADLICHDVQFDWPFVDGFFDSVFSSTCLPEIPAQKFFIEQATRVTSASGWTLFDSIWSLESGALRIDPYRYYRYSQNFLERIRDYVPLFSRAVTDRSVGFDISGSPSRYLQSPPWSFDQSSVQLALSDPRDVEINALVVDFEKFAGFVDVGGGIGIDAELLSFSPAFEVVEDESTVTVVRRDGYADPDVNFASKDHGKLAESRVIEREQLRDPRVVEELFLAGLVVPLPRNFEPGQRFLTDYHARS